MVSARFMLLLAGLRRVPCPGVGRRAGLFAAISIAFCLLVAVRTAQAVEHEAAGRPTRDMTVTVTPMDQKRAPRTFRVVLLCETEEQQRKGLQGFRPLARDEAALFTYLFPVEPTFWMGSVAFPIDIVFVAPDRTVRRVQRDCRPGRTDLYPSGGPVRWVIETAAGSGIRKGDRVQITGPGGRE